ncbi:hypothetical protein [Micromonospora sp. CB01531]|uniref:hypothetical protein n=1 Tax=Micromonospora sp. CB01531 TaxID=1718947 RepID=UPI000AB5D57F|nr:hypothetical protein [Micromonospora sp. CB01531]
MDVPIGWFAAEQAAQNLIIEADGMMAVATFEFRATNDVLALTWLLADIDISSVDLPIASVRLVRAHLSVDQRWRAWCRSQLARAALTEADLRLARHAWRRLVKGRMLAGFTVSGVAADASPLTACCIGLSHARRAIDAYCHRQP